MAVATKNGKQNGRAEVLGPQPLNDAAGIIALADPVAARFTIEGTSPILFHRWSNEAVAEKAKVAKGSAGKKTDDVESYVYRDDDGWICIPGEYVRGALCGPGGAAKFRQDPRSPRKSALDLYKAAIAPLTLLSPIMAEGKRTKKWDYMDMRRVTVQRNAVTRHRPAFNAGWEATFEFQITLPEYVSPMDLHESLILAGRAVGLADYRPTYGRFVVKRFEII